jgi:hypothetical protein
LWEFLPAGARGSDQRITSSRFEADEIGDGEQLVAGGTAVTDSVKTSESDRWKRLWHTFDEADLLGRSACCPPRWMIG